MQFVKGGPDIPEQLLQAHEDGQIVFFCGAGISYPAGLPRIPGPREAAVHHPAGREAQQGAKGRDQGETGSTQRLVCSRKRLRADARPYASWSRRF